MLKSINYCCFIALFFLQTVELQSLLAFIYGETLYVHKQSIWNGKWAVPLYILRSSFWGANGCRCCSCTNSSTNFEAQRLWDELMDATCKVVAIKQTLNWCRAFCAIISSWYICPPLPHHKKLRYYTFCFSRRFILDFSKCLRLSKNWRIKRAEQKLF